MGIRTGVSEDPKGDLSKLLPDQPDPSAHRDAEPLIRRSKRSGPSKVGSEAQTPADRQGLRDRRRNSK